VLLKIEEKNDAAKAFLKFLQSPEAIRIIQGLGYSTPAH